MKIYMKGIPNHLGYFLTKDGIIYSNVPVPNSKKPKKLQKLKPWVDGQTGYLTIYLKGGKKETIHRLMLETYMGPSNGLHCRHLNGIKRDNRIANLKWGTRSENMGIDRIRHGTDNRGEKHGMNKHSAETVLKAKRLLRKYRSTKKVAEELGLGIGLINWFRYGWKHLNDKI